MFFSSILAACALAGAAAATDYGSYGDYGNAGGQGDGMAASQTALGATATPTAAAPSSGSGTQMQVVQVGADGALTFSPNNIQAAPGSMVQFQFNPKNHSVVQSNFAKPCVPISQSQPGSMGFFSGFMPVKPTDSQKPTFTLMVNDTKPIWIYCSQGNHCQKGMVMAINANQTGDKTLDAFTKLAAQAEGNQSPGQSGGSGAASGSTGTILGTATATGLASNATFTTSAPTAAATTAVSTEAAGTGVAISSDTTTAAGAVATAGAVSGRVISGAAFAGALAAVICAAL